MIERTPSKSSAITPANSYTTPWTARAYDALPGTHFRIGICFTAAVLGVYIVGRIMVDGSENSTPKDLRLAIIHILLAGYSASMYAYLLTTAKKSAHALASTIGPALTRHMIVDRAGKHHWWALLCVAIAVNLIAAAITIQSTTGLLHPWDWQALEYDVRWHRVVGLFFSWWIGCSLYVVVVESARLSRLSDDIQSLDLLELRRFEPLVRQGLTNALLVVGMASVMSLFVLDLGFILVLVGAWIAMVIIAWVGLTLPLRGIRAKIRNTTNQELQWCQHALKTATEALKTGAVRTQSIADIIAYKTTIVEARTWPFDNPTLVRFALYLLIPLGSWVGAAFVERGLDLFLSF
ncbi:MAG: hypothetical protein VB948_13020 [Pseudomonadales bacterium]